jgi:hypothetical protein
VVVEMLKLKQAGMPVRKEAPVAALSTVVNLIDALRRSIQAEQLRLFLGQNCCTVRMDEGRLSECIAHIDQP